MTEQIGPAWPPMDSVWRIAGTSWSIEALRPSGGDWIVLGLDRHGTVGMWPLEIFHQIAERLA